MFTGIVQELGKVEKISKGPGAFKLAIKAPELASTLKEGDSVMVNGVCLTATSLTRGQFTVDVSPVTREKTDVGDLRTGSTVNLERALTLSDGLGGHLVSGHVDAVGQITSKAKEQNAVVIKIKAPADLAKYLAPGGSVAVDGISLTVVDAKAEGLFSVSIIPHTAKVTTLGQKEAGDRVNIEVDMIARYVERFLATGLGGNVAEDRASKARLSEQRLRELGF